MRSLCSVCSGLSRKLGLGDANEIVVLLVIQNVSWYLVVFSRFRSFARAAFLLTSTMVLFICFMAEQLEIFIVSFLFGVVSLWWLLGNYWSQLGKETLDCKSTTIHANTFAVFSALALIVLAGALAWELSADGNLIGLRGFSPFSGGSNGTSDAFARSGIGDGDMLTSGENATTTGAVDSDQFIEDDKPSIYDIASDTFEAPLKITKRNNRAVALDAKTKHLHEVVQSELSGKSFRTVRKSVEDRKSDLENRVTDALFFVEGSVPARFSLDCFYHFDGIDWHKAELSAEDIVLAKIEVEYQHGKPWFFIRNVNREYLTAKRTHQVKMMRLDTSTLPAPSLLQSWHINRVDRKNMFRWNDDGFIRIDGDCIPTQTVIHVTSKVPNYHTLRSSKNLQLVDHPHPAWESVDHWLGVETKAATSITPNMASKVDPDSPLLQIPDNKAKSRITSLANAWTADHQLGWSQVEAIVERLRTEFRCDPALVASQDGSDSVSCFLDQGGGPA